MIGKVTSCEMSMGEKLRIALSVVSQNIDLLASAPERDSFWTLIEGLVCCFPGEEEEDGGGGGGGLKLPSRIDSAEKYREFVREINTPSKLSVALDEMVNELGDADPEKVLELLNIIGENLLILYPFQELESVLCVFVRDFEEKMKQLREKREKVKSRC